MSDDALFQCKGCGGWFPREAFGGTKRRGQLCVTCKAGSEGNASRKRKRPWDYVAALHKTVKCRVNRIAYSPKDMLGGSIDERSLRALFRAQEDRCAITNARFHLPTVEELVAVSNNGKGHHVTLDSWADKYRGDPTLKARIPELIRVSEAGPWEIDNVMLVCRSVADYTKLARSLGFTPGELAQQIVDFHKDKPKIDRKTVTKNILDIRKEEEAF